MITESTQVIAMINDLRGTYPLLPAVVSVEQSKQHPCTFKVVFKGEVKSLPFHEHIVPVTIAGAIAVVTIV